MSGKRRVLSMSVVPGDPLDGTGRICIHLFVIDPSGTFTEPHVLHQELDEGGRPTGKVLSRPTRGRLACSRKLGVRPITHNGVTTITHRSDDPRAVTCPSCMTSDAYTSMMSVLKSVTGQ